MSINIPAVVDRLNELAKPHAIGKLQAIRKSLKKLKTQPGTKIFNTQSTFRDYAFHYGGRTELQFNIGHADDGYDSLRHGVAFSFELSQGMPSINGLIPRVKLFNDFMELNGDEFRDMRMWHYDENHRRSVDRPPGPIPPGLVTEGVFVFLGNRQPKQLIDYKRILNDFDRLLPLYLYVESRGATAPLPLPKTGFSFKAGHSQKASTASATQTERELDIELRHNVLQDSLYHSLVITHGVDNVSTELSSGVGTQIDVVVQTTRNEYWFYEIKTSLTARACLREAIGQLLEYGFWPGAQQPTRLIVVGENPIDAEGKEYILKLRKRFFLPIEYQTWHAIVAEAKGVPRSPDLKVRV